MLDLSVACLISKHLPLVLSAGVRTALDFTVEIGMMQGPCKPTRKTEIGVIGGMGCLGCGSQGLTVSAAYL